MTVSSCSTGVCSGSSSPIRVLFKTDIILLLFGEDTEEPFKETEPIFDSLLKVVDDVAPTMTCDVTFDRSMSRLHQLKTKERNHGL